MADIVRSPICTIVGHVDHGKTTILDSIRGTSVAAREAGAITQAIGASIIPLASVKKVCGDLLNSLKISFTIPGLLFIDTPGHAAFTNLRKRGGNLADIAVLVVDIREGIKPQTAEAIEILRSYKTPFIIAANKIDLISGWRQNNVPLVKSIEMQGESVKAELDKKLYELVGAVYEKFGFTCDRFDRVEDFTKQVAIVPCSGKTHEGLPELLMVITGLAQKYLEQCLKCAVAGPAKGTILEVKEGKGLGTTLDVILYDGTLKLNDTIVIGTLGEPIVTKVKAMFEPAPLAEMREIKSKFVPVKEAHAATGVKISAHDIDGAVAGMPVRAASEDNLDEVRESIKSEIEEVLIETDETGIIIKADSLGSLEAMIKLLREKNINIRRASIGDINKKDISDAQCSLEAEPLECAILGFNVKPAPDLGSVGVKIITENVIYKLIEKFEEWQLYEKKRLEQKELEGLVMPVKFQIMKGYIFRQNNPAVVGCDILEGTLRVGTPIMKDGMVISHVKSMEMEQKSVKEAQRGKQLAVAMPGVTAGRQINEGDTLYSGIPEDDFRKLKEFKHLLKREEVGLLKEIAEIMRKNNPLWGV